MMRRSILAVTAAIFLSACEKKIDFDLDEQEPKLVVEGVIEAGQVPVFILSNSLDYFSEISPEILAGSFVRGADIRVSNGVTTHKLKEYSVPSPAGELYYYSVDSADLATAFAGEEGKSYQVTIESAGKTYNSSTTIPFLTKTIDSLWWKPSPNNPDTSLVIMMARVTDPPGFGNYIRFFNSTNGGPFNPGFNSVFDDQVVDGTTYDIEVEKGVDRNEEIDFETYSFFTRGDSVVMKFTNIDKVTFDFWRTMEYNYSSIGSPFSSPTKVLGNISNGALGYFGGYAVQYTTLVIPK
ncbi:DUF4249 domain-containing protein [Flavihumibacter solisilvae]|nr:DUF4249 domain-containing protein [Flavihumibacter solisilvae]